MYINYKHIPTVIKIIKKKFFEKKSIMTVLFLFTDKMDYSDLS